ncbi:hypothetical protein QA645_40780 [Bradyrhizobium sp. CIAT3101]|uniref:hypothetical protein n=1 Tax=Bradyrhizobium sp. CIAT3101 TaxID=439387 RepID=UPI0024B105AA|nr:hypothetical protein [Bradyrhizobium sp. CIAT3101]WFU80691.1 hypothetical protein QA645_40780 [Bradyrhizobium sp. CIAT3101]
MPDRHVDGCIYCGNPGPYTAEHVVSAGLGGDDNTWLLKDLVCGVCNTDIFSKLETKFLRSSGAAWARLFLQEKGRGSGKKASKPGVDADLTYFHEPSSGRLLVARWVTGGQPITLPQIIARLLDNGDFEHAVTGGDTTETTEFLRELAELLQLDQIEIIEKQSSGSKTIFLSMPVTWDGRFYVAGQQQAVAKVPKPCIWYEERVRPAMVDPNAILPSAIFKRPEGQIVCRVPAPRSVATLLSLLRRFPSVWQPSVLPDKVEKVDGPDIHSRFSSDPEADRRVLTKIGINLSAFLLGEAIVRHAAFDRAVEYARTGQGKVEDTVSRLSKLPTLAGRDLHIFALLPETVGSSRHSILFHAQVYGGPVICLRLAEFDEPLKDLPKPIVVLVDYQKHKIEKTTEEAYEAMASGAAGETEE